MKIPDETALPVVLVDDESDSLLSESMTLQSAGLRNVIECQDSRELMPLLKRTDAGVVVLDLSMPFISGEELLPLIVSEHPDTPVIILTGIDEVTAAVHCMKGGAFDYLVKPVDDERFVNAVRHAVEHREMRQENSQLKQYLLTNTLKHPEAFSAIVTRDPAMHAIFKYAEAVAPTSLPKLITGETGVGKELVARAIHQLSGRQGEFVAVNVAGVDDNLFSDTLFGHMKGAFTGADAERKGLIVKSARGTLFLDEIGDLRPESQVKLLRLVQEGKYYPLGSDVAERSDARIIVATNKDIHLGHGSGGFRTDLYYRLQTHHIHIPPLRNRKDDIPALTLHFIEKAARTLGKKTPTPPRELFTLLKTYNFPGNVRELEGMIFDAVSQHVERVMSMDSFRSRIRRTSQGHASDREESHPEGGDPGALEFPERLPTLDEAEHLLIAEALKRSDGNQAIAALMLGVSRRALNNRLARLRRETPLSGSG